MIKEVGEKLVKRILDLVEADRTHQTVNRTVIFGVIQSFVAVKEYNKKESLKV